MRELKKRKPRLLREVRKRKLRNKSAEFVPGFRLKLTLLDTDHRMAVDFMSGKPRLHQMLCRWAPQADWIESHSENEFRTFV